jgi:hypothetical protein
LFSQNLVQVFGTCDIVNYTVSRRKIVDAEVFELRSRLEYILPAVGGENRSVEFVVQFVQQAD